MLWWDGCGRLLVTQGKQLMGRLQAAVCDRRRCARHSRRGCQLRVAVGVGANAPWDKMLASGSAKFAWAPGRAVEKSGVAVGQPGLIRTRSGLCGSKSRTRSACTGNNAESGGSQGWMITVGEEKWWGPNANEQRTNSGGDESVLESAAVSRQNSESRRAPGVSFAVSERGTGSSGRAEGRAVCADRSRREMAFAGSQYMPSASMGANVTTSS